MIEFAINDSEYTYVSKQEIEFTYNNEVKYSKEDSKAISKFEICDHNFDFDIYLNHFCNKHIIKFPQRLSQRILDRDLYNSFLCSSRIDNFNFEGFQKKSRRKFEFLLEKVSEKIEENQKDEIKNIQIYTLWENYGDISINLKEKKTKESKSFNYRDFRYKISILRSNLSDRIDIEVKYKNTPEKVRFGSSESFFFFEGEKNEEIFKTIREKIESKIDNNLEEYDKLVS